MSGNGPRAPSFRIPAIVRDPYKEYSEPWFGTHKVLRGASFATPAGRGARALPQFLHPRSRRHVRRLPHLRAMSSPDLEGQSEGEALGEARQRRALSQQRGRALIEGPHLLAAALQRRLEGRWPCWSTEEGARQHGDRRAAAGMTPVIVAKGVFGAIVEAETRRAWRPRSRSPRQRQRRERRGVPRRRAGSRQRRRHHAQRGGVRHRRGGPRPRLAPIPGRPRALRAGMGGHFALAIRRSRRPCRAIDAFDGTLACTVPRGGVPLGEATLKAGWAGSSAAKGAGVSDEVDTAGETCASRSRWRAGTESLNVAAAAAICLYEASRQGLPSRSAAGSCSSRRMVVAISSIDLLVELMQRTPSRRIRVSASATS